MGEYRNKPCSAGRFAHATTPAPYHAPCGCYYDKLGPDPTMTDPRHIAWAVNGGWSCVKSCDPTRGYLLELKEQYERDRLEPSYIVADKRAEGGFAVRVPARLLSLFTQGDG
jgi:hypothetical protein